MSKTPEEMAKEWANQEVPQYHHIDCTPTPMDCYAHKKAERGFLAGYKAAQEWISVKDRLPEEGMEVVIGWFQQTASNKLYWTIDVAILRNKAFGGWRNYPEATHWLELPTPPKEEK